MKTVLSLALSLFWFTAFAFSQGGVQPGPGIVYAVAGGGGDPVAFVGTEYAAAETLEEDPAVTGSFTPNAGSRLMAVVCISTGGNTYDVSHLSITDSQGLTWTEVNRVGYTDAFRRGFAVWTSSAAAASAMTVTINSSTSDLYGTIIVVTEWTGTDGTSTGWAGQIDAPLTGGYTRTLAAAPTADDASIFVRVVDLGTTTHAMSGWTEAANVSLGGAGLHMTMFYRTGSTATGCTSSAVEAGDEQAVDACFNLKAG